MTLLDEVYGAWLRGDVEGGLGHCTEGRGLPRSRPRPRDAWQEAPSRNGCVPDKLSRIMIYWNPKEWIQTGKDAGA